MAEGIDALVLDVKCGDGAFLRGRDEARALAQTMLGIGKGMGKRVAALITDMDQPLGRTAGNALEVAECVETLKGRGPTDLESLSVELAAWMVHLGGAAASLDAARARVREALASGAGLERFRRVIELQGGNPRVCDDPVAPAPGPGDGRGALRARRARGAPRRAGDRARRDAPRRGPRDGRRRDRPLGRLRLPQEGGRPRRGRRAHRHRARREGVPPRGGPGATAGGHPRRRGGPSPAGRSSSTSSRRRLDERHGTTLLTPRPARVPGDRLGPVHEPQGHQAPDRPLGPRPPVHARPLRPEGPDRAGPLLLGRRPDHPPAEPLLRGLRVRVRRPRHPGRRASSR